MSDATKEIILILIALAVAFFITYLMKKSMNTAVIKTEAEDYVVENSLDITRSLDVFTYSTVIKTPRPKDNSD